MLRFLLAVVAGMALAFVGVIAVELFSAVVHPLPPELQAISDPNQHMEAMCRHVANYPAWVLAVVVPMWLGVVYAGVWAAAKIQGRAAGLTVAGLLLALLAMNLAMLPYAWWFPVAMLLGAPVVAWRAARNASPKNALAEADAPPGENQPG